MPNASPGRRQYGHPGATLARMTTPRLLATAALLMTAAVLTISGCTSGTGTTHAAASRAPASGTPAPSPTTAAASPTPIPTGTYRDQVMTWGRQFAACVRAHGIANFPDPVYPAGVAANGPDDHDLFPDGSFGTALFPVDKGMLIRAMSGACSDLARQMPPAPDSIRPVNAAQLAAMRRFSQCMRRHGFADFPDPKADGTFPIQGGPYDSLLPYHNGGTAQLTNAYLACDQNQRIPMRAS
jgi:hypothetical protein